MPSMDSMQPTPRAQLPRSPDTSQLAPQQQPPGSNMSLDSLQVGSDSAIQPRVAAPSAVPPKRAPRPEEPPAQHYPAQPKASFSSTALIVKSPDGVILQCDKKLTPHPEHKMVHFNCLKGANAVVKAHIDEINCAKYVHPQNPHLKQQIKVETASGIPLAHIDTTYASYPPNQAPPREMRRATISRVAGGSFDTLGSPCATVLSLSPDTFVVLSALGGAGGQDHKETLVPLQQMVSQGHPIHRMRPDVLLTVHADRSGCVNEMRDVSGVVARQEGNSGMFSTDTESIWVRQGADITLITCIVLAVAKLA